MTTPEYRRWFVPGGTIFLTAGTNGRRPPFAEAANVTRLRKALAAVRDDWPFGVVAAVVLADHLHFLWSLPDGDTGYPKRLGRLKALFTQSLPADAAERLPTSQSRYRHRESGVWQRRFWEHTVRDEDDLEAHLDYIHYNPVRHRLVGSPADWPWSRVGMWVKAGQYPPDWGASVNHTRMDRVANAAGE